MGSSPNTALSPSIPLTRRVINEIEEHQRTVLNSYAEGMDREMNMSLVLSLDEQQFEIMKMEITTTTMRIIGVIIEAIGPIGANIITGDHTEGLSTGEGDNKITIKANFKATAGNLILFVVAIIIITMIIVMAEVAVDTVATFIGHMVAEEAITEAITTINTINIIRTIMGLNLSNMVHHAHFVEASIILLNIVLRENTKLTILWRK